MTFDEIKYKLSQFSVGIAGCGGLGSNCAVALARMGIGQLVIADFDTIVESNLNRQYFFYDQIGLKKSAALKTNLHRIAPNCQVVAHEVKIGPTDIPQLFHACDVIVEAFDDAGQKKMLIENVSKLYPEKLLVCASGLAGWEHLESIGIQQFGNLVVCGDHLTEVSDECPPLAPKVAIVANMQANVVLNYLLNLAL